MNDPIYVVRTNRPATPALFRRIDAIVASMNPRVPVVNVRAMTQVVERSMSRTSFIMVLLGAASFVALALSAVGMYGVISYVVEQHHVEIGLRLALAASRVSSSCSLCVLPSPASRSACSDHLRLVACCRRCCLRCDQATQLCWYQYRCCCLPLRPPPASCRRVARRTSIRSSRCEPVEHP
jgi:hypothetical protein